MEKLTSSEQSMVDSFHKLYYYRDNLSLVLNNTKWFGVEVAKTTTDLMTYQEIIFDTKPDVIIETGTYHGGSALFMANMMDLLGKGKVISIDIMDREKNPPMHNRITYIKGDSTSNDIINKVKTLIGNRDKVMVVLDSCHTAAHVKKELELYSPLVSLGCYLVAEDTNLSGHPVEVEYSGGGPFAAVHDFINKNDEFIIDKNREKYLLTFFPDGFLLRVK